MLSLSAGFYLHVPFCRQKCAYCDFVSYPTASADADTVRWPCPHQRNMVRYVRAVKREVARRGSAGGGASITMATLYIGGGTPTVLPVEFLVEILDELGRYFHWPPGLEATVEANPETVRPADLERLRRVGINRISIGMQAAQDTLLATLGRGHRLNEVREAVRSARRAGFENLNLDLISGIPGQTPDDWRRTLESAIALEPEHIAAYSLEISPGTRLHARVEAGELKPGPEDEVLEMFNLTREMLIAAGYEHYELANFARPGYACQHNLIYWHNEPYLGFGPAAHSYWRGQRSANERDPAVYAARLADGGELPVAEIEEHNLRTEMAETMFLGLRLRCGVSWKRFGRRFGRDLDAVYGDEIAWLQRQGLVEVRDGYLRLTERGLPLANLVFERFL